MWSNHTHSVTTMLSESLCLCIDRSADCYTFRDMVVCVPRVSVCKLEADGLAADILNRHELSVGKATGNLTKQCHPCRNLRLGFQYVNSTATPLPFLSFSPPSPSPSLSLPPPLFLFLHSIRGISWAGCNLGGREAEETVAWQQCLHVTPTLPRYPPQPHASAYSGINCVGSVGQQTKGATEMIK